MKVIVKADAFTHVRNAAGVLAWRVSVPVRGKPVPFWATFADGSTRPHAPHGEEFEVDFEPDDQFAMVRYRARYTLESAGRVIHQDGKPFVELAFVSTDLSPEEKDDRAKAICTALNAMWG